MSKRNRLVFEAAHAQGIPLVVFMGGGYAKPIDASMPSTICSPKPLRGTTEPVYEGDP